MSENKNIIRSVYFYIDESGTLQNNTEDNFFILSCFITDTPDHIRSALKSLRDEILSDPYNFKRRQKFQQDGFHAAKNHPDIRTSVYTLLLGLNFRAYSVVIDKTAPLFQELTQRFASEELYNYFVRELLYDRVLSERDSELNFIFEEYGNSKTKHKDAMTTVISRICQEIRKNGASKEIFINVAVESKDELLLAVTDYINFVIFQMLQDAPQDRMKENFIIIEPKIALLHSLHNREYYHSRNSINFEAIKGRIEVNK